MTRMPYFVTIIRSSTQVGALAGPFDTREAAEQYVEPARVLAVAIDSWAHFDSFGVSLIPGRGYPGKLNGQLGLAGPISYPVWAEGQPEHYHGEGARHG